MDCGGCHFTFLARTKNDFTDTRHANEIITEDSTHREYDTLVTLGRDNGKWKVITRIKARIPCLSVSHPPWLINLHLHNSFLPTLIRLIS